MLKSLGLKAVYLSDEDDLLRDFYIPALCNSVRYDRAVGFFSGAMLSYAAQGLSTLVANNGYMRLVVGGELDEEDVVAIERGYNFRAISEKLGRGMLHALDSIDDELFQRRVELLSWLVANGRLEIKVALKRRGMFHAKIGILTDVNNDSVVFQGSANETVYALLPDFNFETINVFPSWRSELKEHFEPHIRTFERLWRNDSKGTIVIDFPTAVYERFIMIAKCARVLSPKIEQALWDDAFKRYSPGRIDTLIPRLPAVLGGRPFEIMKHQREALLSWRAAGGHGILALATGAGKTVTAIYAAIRTFEVAKRLCVVIAVPYQGLADQWIEVLRTFSINAYGCYGGVQHWHDDAAQAVHFFEQNAWPFLCLVVVNKTLQGNQFQQLLSRLPGENMFWVGDECHHHGSTGINSVLPERARFRMGLSATPEHYLNQDANLRLENYYGRVEATYGLEEALRDKVLTPYRYQIELVDLTDIEAEEYGEISERIARLVAQSGGRFDGDDSNLDYLLFQRARLLGGAANKITTLERLLNNTSPISHTLFYCSDASVKGKDDFPQRQVEAVSMLLHQLGWRNSRFTARENSRERRMILDGFRLGDIDALVAIRCLDEGIDVPACQRAYILASSRNPRQFVQRRGRILRRSPGKDIAHIVDLMVRLPMGIVQNEATERKLLVDELQRASEFARLARNNGEVVSTLMPLLEQYDLVHHLV